MEINKLKERANNKCEICENVDDLKSYAVLGADKYDEDVLLCEICRTAIESSDYSNSNHWRVLTGSIWSETPAVQALSYSILNKLKTENWAQECLESVFIDENIVIWALSEEREEESKLIHKDAFGNILLQGDNVVLIENLNVKGTNYIAPKGTQVKKIRLVHDNAEQIEGKINNDTIVILTKFLKKS